MLADGVFITGGVVTVDGEFCLRVDHRLTFTIGVTCRFASFARRRNHDVIVGASNGWLMTWRLVEKAGRTGLVPTLVSKNFIAGFNAQMLCSLSPHEMFIVFGQEITVVHGETCLAKQSLLDAQLPVPPMFVRGAQIFDRFFLAVADTGLVRVYRAR